MYKKSDAGAVLSKKFRKVSDIVLGFFERYDYREDIKRGMN